MANDPMIKASHEKAKNSYGQNGSPQPSSLLPGQTKSPIADVAPPQGKVEGLRPEDQLSARVKMDPDGDKTVAEYSAHPSMSHRSTTDGSPGGTVPSKTSHSPRR